MIKKFSGNNYKAFEEFDLEFKPLTILLGSNSTGKSAIVNSLLMLSQSSDKGILSESPLRINGNKTGMGEALNIITDKNSSKSVSFCFYLDEDEKTDSLVESFNQSRFSLVDVLLYASFHVARQVKAFFPTSKKITNILKETDSHMAIRSGDRLRVVGKDFIKNFRSLLGYYRKLPMEEQERTDHLFGSNINNFLVKASLVKILDCFDQILSIAPVEFCPVCFKYSFSYDAKSKNLKVSSYEQINRAGKTIFKFVVDKDSVYTFESGVYEAHALNRSKKDIIDKISQSSFSICKEGVEPVYSGWGLSFTKNSENPFAALFLSQLAMSSSHLLSQLSQQKINHVSPLRAFPQRYYLLDKSIHHKKLNALDGTELAEILKNNPSIRKNINILLAPFNIGIDVEKVNDIIHKIVVTQDSVRLELTDVGFGISQVLPILVQAYLSPERSLTIIEQPEIHLHPNMQAWLTDALIDIAIVQNKRFLIETHSDALIRRVRLRILDSASALSDDDVKIYHLYRSEVKNRTLLEEIPINSDGDIKWPLDFMDAEIKDTVEIQRLKSEKAAQNTMKG